METFGYQFITRQTALFNSVLGIQQKNNLIGCRHVSCVRGAPNGNPRPKPGLPQDRRPYIVLVYYQERDYLHIVGRTLGGTQHAPQYQIWYSVLLCWGSVDHQNNSFTSSERTPFILGNSMYTTFLEIAGSPHSRHAALIQFCSQPVSVVLKLSRLSLHCSLS